MMKRFVTHFVPVYADTVKNPPIILSRQFNSTLSQVAFIITDMRDLIKQANPYSTIKPNEFNPHALKRQRMF